jgi:GntR family transcriptional regulator
MQEDRDAEGVPKYVQLARTLRRRIAAQEYRPGEQIPTEAELCRVYGVSRITVREAVARLAQEGLLTRSQGRGTYVARPRLLRSIDRLYSFSTDMRALGLEPASRVLALARDEASPEEALRLGLPAANRFVTRVRRLRLADGIPVLLEDTLVPDHLCPGLAGHDLANDSLYRCITEDYRLAIHHAEETYEAVILSATEAAALACEGGRPSAAFAIQRVARLSDGAPVELTRAVGRGDLLTLAVTLSADKADLMRVFGDQRVTGPMA